MLVNVSTENTGCVWCETSWIDRISSSHQWRKQTCPSHLVCIRAQTIHVFAKITGGYWPIADSSIRASVSIQANYSVDDMLKFSNQPLSAHRPTTADVFVQVCASMCSVTTVFTLNCEAVLCWKQRGSTIVFHLERQKSMRWPWAYMLIWYMYWYLISF